MAYTIEANSITQAWVEAVNFIVDHPGKEMAPLLISLSDFDLNDIEGHDPVKNGLDHLLISKGLNSINTVANTIFPQSLYALARFDRHKLYELYLRQISRLKALDQRNHDGLYFERLIYFDDQSKLNQLEFIISAFTARPAVRRSLLQASIFDPRRDHTRKAQLGFPCLQHLSFTYEGQLLTLNAFYATQQLFDKAYGNMLGLVRLGNFMAREMHLSLHQANFYIGVEKLDRITKTDKELTQILSLANQLPQS